MGASIDKAALTSCIRDALHTHLQDTIGEPETLAIVFEGDGDTIVLDVNGFVFTLTLQDAGSPRGAGRGAQAAEGDSAARGLRP